MESNHEALKRNQEILEEKSEQLKKQIKKDLEILNKKIENNNETLQRQLKEDSEKNWEELRYILIGYRKEVKQTKTGMNKKWEETNYQADQPLSLIHIYIVIIRIKSNCRLGIQGYSGKKSHGESKS